MESPGLIWIPTGQSSANLRYLAAHETAHQWFYGIVGNDQAREPFADEAAADFVGPLRPRAPARQPLRDRRASTCRSTSTPSRATTRRIYIQGGNLLDEARRRMGSTAFWAALRGYVAAHRSAARIDLGRCCRRSTTATPLDLGGTLFAPRFPRIY